MGEYIEREAAVNSISKLMPNLTTPDGTGQFDEEIFKAQELIVDCMETIHKIPTADVVEVKHGEWIYNVKYYSCSICAGKRFNLLLGTDAEYCPYCGAKMDLKEGAEK